MSCESVPVAAMFLEQTESALPRWHRVQASIRDRARHRTAGGEVLLQNEEQWESTPSPGPPGPQHSLRRRCLLRIEIELRLEAGSVHLGEMSRRWLDRASR